MVGETCVVTRYVALGAMFLFFQIGHVNPGLFFFLYPLSKLYCTCTALILVCATMLQTPCAVQDNATRTCRDKNWKAQHLRTPESAGLVLTMKRRVIPTLL
ncbi:hypothetical protein V8C35DRAFT_312423 [Trichoderma chlorosporum]